MRYSSPGSVESRGDVAVAAGEVQEVPARGGMLLSAPEDDVGLWPFGVVEDHGELVAADARGGVALADRLAQREAELPQQVVTVGVARWCR